MREYEFLEFKKLFEWSYEKKAWVEKSSGKAVSAHSDGVIVKVVYEDESA